MVPDHADLQDKLKKPLPHNREEAFLLLFLMVSEHKAVNIRRNLQT